MREAREVIAKDLIDGLTGDEPQGVDAAYFMTDRILTALSSAGLAVVPVEPTKEMIAAWSDIGVRFDDDVWRAGIRVAALPPLASGGG